MYSLCNRNVVSFVQREYITCAQHVHNMCATCAQHVHKMCIRYVLSVLLALFSCTLFAQKRAHFSCTLCAPLFLARTLSYSSCLSLSHVPSLARAVRLCVSFPLFFFSPLPLSHTHTFPLSLHLSLCLPFLPTLAIDFLFPPHHTFTQTSFHFYSVSYFV